MNTDSIQTPVRKFVTFVIRTLFERWWLTAPAFLLFIYVAFRAAVVAITWDEAHTFFEYVRSASWLPHSFDYMSANNHLLNTWLMKCSVMLFGESELALRLPNVLAGGVYFFAAGKLAEHLFPRRPMALLAFLVLSLNPFVLDFFSTARGYGISLALLLCACIQLARYVNDSFHLRPAIVAQILLALATLANLTLVHVLLAAAMLLFVHRLMFHRRPGFSKQAFLLTLVPVITVGGLLPYIIQLKRSGALFYGEEVKSPGAMFFSISEFSFYGASYSALLTPVMTVLLSAIPLIALLLVMRNATRMLNDSRGRWGMFLTLFLILSITGPVLQHLLLGSHYLAGRTALFYLPLLALNFLCMLLVFPPWLRLAGLGLAGIFSLAHFSLTSNANILFDWREQADVKQAMLLLKEKNPPVAENCFANIISTDLPYEKQVNYYRMRFRMDNFGHAARKESVPACSYYYLPADSMKNFGSCEVLREFPATRTALFRVKDPGRLVPVREVWQDFEHEDPFLELMTDTIFLGDKGTFANVEHLYSINVWIAVPDSVEGPLVASLNCRLNYFSRNCSALLVFTFNDGKDPGWEAMHLTELSSPPGEWSITGWTRPVPPGTKKVRVYLMNTGGREVLMDNVALRLLRQDEN
jgi:hypothetical protein